MTHNQSSVICRLVRYELIIELFINILMLPFTCILLFYFKNIPLPYRATWSLISNLNFLPSKYRLCIDAVKKEIIKKIKICIIYGININIV